MRTPAPGPAKLHFSAVEQRALLDYWRLYEQHHQAIADETRPIFTEHPEFGPLLRGMSVADQEESGNKSRERLRAAIEDGDWQPYETELRTQGAFYAQLGISFAGWYDVVTLFQGRMVPLLVDAYCATPERLKAVLHAMQRLIDTVMVIIGEEYLATKERALRASEAERVRSEEASRAKTDFLAMMSHELRTPLNAIIGFSELLLDEKFGPLSEVQLRFQRNVHQSGRHLLGLISDLLDLSKIEAGRLDIVRDRCSPLYFVKEVAGVLQPLADARGCLLSVDTIADVPLVLADKVRFKQVLYNLLSNAIKFSPPRGEVKVRFTVTDDGFLRTAVSDQGAGIPSAALSRLFVPFSQLENAREASGEGTGLGLALSRRLAELMGGRVGVNSIVGEGSTFFIDLVRDQTAPLDDRPEAAPLVLPLALVIDDDSASAELLTIALADAGYRTLRAASGEEGLALARSQHPQVVTLDVFLPTVDGWDVLRVLKGDPDTREIPVVMVTISEDRRKAFSLGALEHMVKPIDRQQLMATLARRGFTSRAQQQPLHILVVDDDPQQLELLRAELELRGFRVRTALSGRAGVEAARSGPVDLLLLDLLMPDISGVEVVEALKRDERTLAIPIILITAAELTAHDHRRLNGDVVSILAKGTLDTDRLIAEIARATRSLP